MQEVTISNITIESQDTVSLPYAWGSLVGEISSTDRLLPGQMLVPVLGHRQPQHAIHWMLKTALVHETIQGFSGVPAST